MKTLNEFLNERKEPSSIDELGYGILNNLDKKRIKKVEKEANRFSTTYFYTVHYEGILPRGVIYQLMKQDVEIQWIAPSDVRGCVAIKYSGS